jgi:tetratricopeptide (TPR) repeat protein
MTRALTVVFLVPIVLAGIARAQDPVSEGVAKARSLVAEGKVEAGLGALRKLADDHPDNRLPHWWLANLLYQKAGRNREAAEVIAGFLEQHPEDTYALELLKSIAHHALEAGDADVTRWCIEYLIRFDPGEKANYYLAALASYRLGDRGSARMACREIINRWPSHADAYRLLARVYEDGGQFGLAAETYRSLIEEKPGYPLARILLANILRVEFRDYRGAEKEFTDALLFAEPGTPDHREATRGLEQTRADRALADRLRKQEAMLSTLITVLLAVAAAATGAAVFLTRPRG